VLIEDRESSGSKAQGIRNVDVLLQRMMGLATPASTPGKGLQSAVGGCDATRTPRWVVSGVLWLVLLLLPGSFLLLPAFLWWKARRR
jgi:hypothetical protein